MNDNSKLTLRALEPEDLDMLYRVENDTAIWDVGPTNVPYSRYLLHDYIATAKGDIYIDGQIRLIVENSSGEAVGLADITNFDPKNRRAEVGIIIAREHRRQHYAQQTLIQLADYALHVLHLHQLYAVVDATNTASCQLFLKSGYHVSTELKDWLYDGKSYHQALLMQIFL